MANTSTDGMLVVDSDGRVCLANPAVEALLSRGGHDLVGRIFGLPIMLGEVAEISLLQPDGRLLSAEMRTTPIMWRDTPGYLIVLRDLTERRRIQEALRDAEGFSRAILNSLSHHIAVLDERGIIVLVNDAWRQFAAENGDPQLLATGVGANYFDVCAMSTGSDSEEAPDVLDGMRRVLSGDLPFFELEYPCHSPEEERWFHLRVVPLHSQRRGMVISHTNITVQRQHARVAAEAEALREQLQARERELQTLMAISGVERARPVLLAQRAEYSLRASSPSHFRDGVSRYGDLLDAAVKERGFGVPDNESSVRLLATQLGDLHAAARDVVEIHLSALRSRSAGVTPDRQQAYLEEGRMLALQIMGYLVAYYRDGTLP
ncbi:MAG: PAS domain-containing protein [Oscillochloris sp.]|nr:PAS domain-containing protein [Oscillochloris sp.]